MRDTTRHPNLPDYTLQAYMNLRSRCPGFYEPDERCPRVDHCVCYSIRRSVETGVARSEAAEAPLTRNQLGERLKAERRRAWRFILGLFALAFVSAFLFGCTSTGIRPTSSTMVGPYDIGLSSHREALGLEP